MGFLRRLIGGPPAPPPPPAINDRYVTGAPSAQNAVDIFKGAWSSRFPPPLDQLQAGPMELFDDPRVKWFLGEVGSLGGKRVLELGPLEGGHSYLLDRAGAEEVVAVEANTVAYCKCLIAKELLGMQRVRFLCGDFLEYLRDPSSPPFDVGVAAGVLYHMDNPVELIALLSRSCREHLYIWTHYYDQARMDAGTFPGQFPSRHAAEHAGFSHTLIRQDYSGVALGSSGFCGGQRPHSHWMLREEILGCLKHFGFPRIAVSFEQPDHPHGPAFSLIASRA